MNPLGQPPTDEEVLDSFREAAQAEAHRRLALHRERQAREALAALIDRDAAPQEVQQARTALREAFLTSAAARTACDGHRAVFQVLVVRAAGGDA